MTVVSCDGVITAFISNSYTSEEGHNVSQEFCNDRDAESHVYPATPYGDHCPNLPYNYFYVKGVSITVCYKRAWL
ncbi:MAG: hypothetical protein P1U41_05810 [Vicingaceae bacterium]|nr:hypothetical protein [Vicingaceae bacterium]